MKALSKSNTNNSQRDRMLAFYMGQAIVLTKDEEELKIRLNFVRTKLYDWSLSSEDIIAEVVEEFGVSKYRAERDIADANFLFGKSLVIDKTLIAGQIVERIKADIDLIRQAKKFDLLPKLYEALIKANKELPANTDTTAKSKKIILYQIHGNATITPPVAHADALQKARDQYKTDFQDIDHEEVYSD
jgi:hypothetical protein